MGYNIKEKMGLVLGLVILVIISAAMIPILTETIDGAGATGVVGTLLDYMPLFIVVGIALAIILSAVRNIGED